MAIYKHGYNTYDTGRYKITKCNGSPVLRCPKCAGYINLKPFLDSVGARGMSFCPYCGEDLRPPVTGTIETGQRKIWDLEYRDTNDTGRTQ